MLRGYVLLIGLGLLGRVLCCDTLMGVGSHKNLESSCFVISILFLYLYALRYCVFFTLGSRVSCMFILCFVLGMVCLNVGPP
jgi:cytochrome c oxidase assembly factor CtaG